jgi:hypothetical protein
MLGKFQEPAWLRNTRYGAELYSMLGKFQGPAWLRSFRYRDSWLKRSMQVQG